MLQRIPDGEARPFTGEADLLGLLQEIAGKVPPRDRLESSRRESE
jgi:hypothetical protein